MNNADTRRPPPLWLTLSDKAVHIIYERLWRAACDNDLDLPRSLLPVHALRFLIYTLAYSDDANRAGRHAISMALLRQSIESMSIVELGIVRHIDRAQQLKLWYERKITPGNIRKWLEKAVWPNYGCGLWDESWSQYMGQFATALHPYAHFSPELMHWQERFFGFDDSGMGWVMTENDAYDPQKASRITLFHSILHFTLGRILMENCAHADADFRSLVIEFGHALSNSKYLSGHRTDWANVFLAMMWTTEDGSNPLE